MSGDLYSVLGVLRGASQTEIKTAYRRIMRENHADLHPGDAARAARCRDANVAYSVLGDSEKRAQYDAGRTKELPEAAQVLIERLGLGLVEGACEAAKTQAARVGARFGARGSRLAELAGQIFDLAGEGARDKLTDFLRRGR